MCLSAVGYNSTNNLGIESTIENKKGEKCVDSFTQVLDLNGVTCISSGIAHTVVLKGGKLFIAGDDRKFRIGSDSQRIYERFTEIKISEEPISWLAAGDHFTLYLTASGKVILCHESAAGEPILVPLDKKAVSVYGGYTYGGIIDEEGAFHILDTDPQKPLQRFYLGCPAVDLVCCKNFVCVRTFDGRVYGNGKLNNDSHDFAEINYIGKRIEKIDGFIDACVLLTYDGCVFTYGKNLDGQLGNGARTNNYEAFTEILFVEKIKDVSCARHTLFLTESNKIWGCGLNSCYQLSKAIVEENCLYPKYITTIDAADQVMALGWHTFVLSGTGKLSNPVKELFLKKSDNEEIERTEEIPLEKTKQLIDLCQKQSLCISQLMKMNLHLQQQNETSQREIKAMRNEMNEKFDEMNRKLEILVKCINDQDFY